MSKPRFGPLRPRKKGTMGDGAPVQTLQEQASQVITGQMKAISGIEAAIARREQSRARWALIEELLSIEGYEVVPDLFEHSIKKRR